MHLVGFIIRILPHWTSFAISLLRSAQEEYLSNSIGFHKFSTDFMPVATNQPKTTFFSCPAVCNRSVLEASSLWGRSNPTGILATWPTPLIPIDLITLITFGVEYQQIMKSHTIEFPTVFRAILQLSLNYLLQFPILEHPRSIYFLHFKVAYPHIIIKYEWILQSVNKTIYSARINSEFYRNIQGYS